MLEEAKVFFITLSPDCNHFFHKFQWKFWFFLIFPIWMASQNAVFIRISPSGTVVGVYASQTHTIHETDWENRLKQIGPLLNYLLTWRPTERPGRLKTSATSETSLHPAFAFQTFQIVQDWLRFQSLGTDGHSWVAGPTDIAKLRDWQTFLSHGTERHSWVAGLTDIP